VTRVGILGGGAWGTALSTVMVRAEAEVSLWAREAEVVASINDGHMNQAFLPGVKLDPSIRATNELSRFSGEFDALLLVVPAQHLRNVLTELVESGPPNAPAVICTKGIENGTAALMSEVVADVLPEAAVAALSGPTFAAEVARGLPTAVTLACEDRQLGKRLMTMVGIPMFRPYLSTDVIGTQLGGAVKNVLAIACGVVEGMDLGDNTRATIVTRGLAETVRLGVAMGAQRETLMGLSGLGDLTLTCNGRQSRNMSLGIELGKGRTAEDVLSERNSVAEGVATASSVTQLVRRYGVEMPICEAVDGVLHHGVPVSEAVRSLLTRAFTTEASTS
jgi:glycerol-3-phosphate dehydrogenase (NAD(P)+)